VPASRLHGREGSPACSLTTSAERLDLVRLVDVTLWLICVCWSNIPIGCDVDHRAPLLCAGANVTHNNSVSDGAKQPSRAPLLARHTLCLI
jgi:hypothetical protein